MVDDTKKINARADQLLDSVNASAGRVRGSWLSYQAMGAYLFVVVGSTTHKMLLLDSPIKLPILSIDLPIVEFYFLAPLMFLFFHLNLLLQLYLLSGKLGAFRKTGWGRTVHREKMAPHQADPFVFVQWSLANPNSLILRILIWLMVRGTIIIAPPVLLLFFQARFLPYHHDWLTHWHRGILVVDMLAAAVIWLNIGEILGKRHLWGDFWRFLGNLKQWLGGTLQGLWQNAIKSPRIHGPFARPVFLTGWTLRVKDVVSHLLIFFFGAVVISFSLFVATLPGEKLAIYAEKEHLLTSATKWLFEGEVNPVSGKRSSFFSRTLVAPNIVLSNPKSKPSLRGRILRGAVLVGANLQGVDFTGADLREANLSNANLQNAIISCPSDESGAIILEQCTTLQKANLKGAFLQGANLKGASLQEVNFQNARLQGADLRFAGLQGADMSRARLQGADMRSARLQGATLFRARLHGANLRLALLHGATLSLARLQGANFHNAELQGANFQFANLQGANLRSAGLEGANFRRARLQGTDFREVRVWRTDFSDTLARIVDTLGAEWNRLSPKTLAEIIAESVEGIEETGVREQIMETVSDHLKVLQDEVPRKKEWEEVKVWENLRVKKLTRAENKTLPKFLAELACAEENSPYVAAGLIRRARFSPNFDAADFAERVLDPECVGGRKLGEKDKARLRSLIP